MLRRADPIDRLLRWRPEAGTETLVLFASLAFSGLYNDALWNLVFQGRDITAGANLATFVVLHLAVTAIQFAALSLLVTRRTVRPVLAALFVATAAASFFMDRFGVFLDTDMLRNVFRTDPAEARELLTPALAGHVLLYAGVPLLVLWRVRVAPRTPVAALAMRAGVVVGALAFAVIAVMAQYREVSTLLRSHREARHLVTPANFLVSSFRIVRSASAAPAGPRTVVAADARREVTPAGTRPVLLVVVLGETVRSANFGLSGYARQTTPRLVGLDVATFARVRACGTSTEVSVPCMFAAVGRRDYDGARIAGEESLLHALARAGFDVRWIDNQSGCKGVCDGLPTERIAGNADTGLCDSERCLDEILLHRLDAAIREGPRDQVVVLHMLGNHGPAYYRRYPPEFRRFTPTCDTLEIDRCAPAEIVNAYDNAVLYTDHVVASIVERLASMADRDTSLVYVSDHGESLGENGLYLHGLPYGIAPAEQIEVPMVVWLSPGMAARTGLDSACLKARATQPASHDNLFHSILGLLDVSTTVRDRSLDVFSGCRPAVAWRRT